MGRKTVGLVGLWDCVAFDEVAGIKFKDKDGIQIMKDYMASGSFARGKEEKAATASMVFVGNINQSVDVLLKTSSLFANRSHREMGTDTAFLARLANNIIDAYNKVESQKAKEADRKEALLSKISAHVLRHTACIRMAECHRDMKALQYIMGHAHFDRDHGSV